MPIVCVASPKGGVGKTTLTATISVGLHRIGWRVLALDFDRQNSLRLHYELPSDDLPGIADDFAASRDWTQLVVEAPSGVYLVPFGMVAAADGARLSAHIGANPGWVRRQLSPFFEYRDLIMIIDMPPGPSVWDTELDTLADLHLVVLLADAVSLALVPRLQRGDFRLGGGASRRAAPGYVLNQIEPRRRLCRDVQAVARDLLGDRLFGTIHQDEAVAEAAACQSTVLDYAPESVAAHDIAAVANRVHDTLAPA
jgi:cellulose synthase operon protein YhjQ